MSRRPDKVKKVRGGRDGKTWRRTEGPAASLDRFSHRLSQDGERRPHWHQEHEHYSRSAYIPNDYRQALIRGLMRKWNRGRSKKARRGLRREAALLVKSE